MILLYLAGYFALLFGLRFLFAYSHEQSCSEYRPWYSVAFTLFYWALALILWYLVQTSSETVGLAR